MPICELCNAVREEGVHLCLTPPISEGGKKHDSGKVPASLLPATALIEVSKVLQYGAKTYGAHNWREGFDWSRLMDATFRHLLEYNSSVETRKDKDTGLSHLAHAATNLLFLIEFEKMKQGKDDLWKGYND